MHLKHYFGRPGQCRNASDVLDRVSILLTPSGLGLQNSFFYPPISPFFTSTSCSSLGDQLRDIDAAGIITGDFLLLRSGALDVVSNIYLSPLIDMHRERKRSSNSIMTTLFKRLPPPHHARTSGSAVTYIVDGERLVSAHEINTRTIEKGITIQISELQDRKKQPSLEVRFDLVDCRLDICSPEVLALFTENFDYQSMHEDFFHGISQSDILTYQFSLAIIGETILNHCSKTYFSVVDSIFSLKTTTRDVLQRWSYPLVPDIPMLSSLGKLIIPLASPTSKQAPSFDGCQNIKFRRYGTTKSYVGERVSFGSNVRIEGHVLIGSNSSIGSGTVLIDSVIGPETVIANNSTIINSILFSSSASHCNIGAGVLIENALLAPGTIVNDNISIGANAILGTWTFDPLHITSPLPGLTEQTKTGNRWISSALVSAETKSKFSAPSADSSVFLSSDEETSPHSQIIPWSLSISNRLKHSISPDFNSEAEEEETPDGNSQCGISDGTGNIDMRSLSEYLSALVSFNSLLQLNEPYYFSTKKSPWVQETPNVGKASPHPRERRNSASPSVSIPSSPVSQSIGQTLNTRPQFAHEVAETLRYALDYVSGDENEDDLSAIVENACVEINALKFAFNANFPDVRRAVIPVIVQHSLSGESSSKIQKTLELWQPLFIRISHGSSAQSEILSVLLDTCVDSKTGVLDFRWIVSHLYQLDILEEEDILKWWNEATTMDPLSSNTIEHSNVLFSLSAFIEWLEEDEEEDTD